MATVERKRRSSSRAAAKNSPARTTKDAPATDAAKPKRQRKDERKLEKTNEPGVYKREKKSGGYSYVVIVRDQRGKQIKRYAETFREAKDKKSDLRSEINKGFRRPTTQTPFVEYAREWVKTYQGRTSKGLKEQTKRDYKAAVERPEFEDYFKRRRLSDIEPEDLVRYADELRDNGLSARTIRNLIAPIRLCLATAAERRHILFNPVAGVKVIAAMGTGKKARAMTAPEIKALFDGFDRLYGAKKTGPSLRVQLPTHRLLAEFLLQTGLRIGEALALVWSDFTDDFAHVKVERRIYKGDEDSPKSEYSNRKVPLSPVMRDRLREHRGDARGTDHVFASIGGDPLDYYAARRVLRRVSTTAKVNGTKAADGGDLSWVGFHTLRHTCASWLFRLPDGKGGGGLGANAKQAQLWLGHHSPAFTMATYVHLMPEDLPDPAGFDHLIGPIDAGDGGATRGATKEGEIRRNGDAPRARKPPAKTAKTKTARD